MRIACLLGLAAALAVAAPAAGQGSDPGAAAALFRAGRDAAKRGDFATACPKLADSFRLDPAVGTLLNLADCEEHLGRLASAWAHFQQAIEKLGSNDDRLPIAKSRVAALEPRVPRLTIALAPNAARGAKIARDGVEVGEGSIGVALPIDPGLHEIVVTAPNRRPRNFELTVAEREQRRVDVDAGEPAAPGGEGGVPSRVAASSTSSGSPDVNATSGGELRTIGFVVGGVGVAGIGVAIATGLLLPGKQNTVDQHCSASTNVCDSEGYDAAQSGKTLSSINTVAWFAGGILTGVGVALVVFGGPKRTRANNGVALSLHAAGLGGRLAGSF